MASLRGVAARLRGDRVNQLAQDVAALRELALQMNHVVHHHAAIAASTRDALVATNRTLATLDQRLARQLTLAEEQRNVLWALNHDVRSGAEGALPLFLGYTERLRLDTETAIAAAQVIERQLALLEDLVAANEAAGAGTP